MPSSRRLDFVRTRVPALLLCAALLFSLAAAPAMAAGRTALVIGNSAYPTAPLKNPVNDATDMAAALKRLGFDVTLLTDATMRQMEEAVRAFGLKLRGGGIGLFYFAGHGVQVAGENYLVPVNAAIQSEGDVKYGSLNAGLVLAKMEDAGNGPNVVILDACRNNPFARSFRSAEAGLARMDAPTGSLIAYATAPGHVASDGEGRNGVWLAERGLDVLSSDWSRRAQDKARALAARRGVNLRFECADLTARPWIPESFDVVLALNFHLPPEVRDAVFRGIRTSLRPGGLLLIEGIHKKTRDHHDPATLYDEGILRSLCAGLAVERLETFAEPSAKTKIAVLAARP